ncbi:MAG: uracil phosphoribosyltransferase [Planctomycetes bacterium]|nr:uracil phosphoribosyltransferase [Planctomycetota bacterium]
MLTPSKQFTNLRVFEHPLIQHKLSLARNHITPPEHFRRLLNEIAGLMVYEVSRQFLTTTYTVQTPLEPAQGKRLLQPVTLVPILRAGLGMTDGILRLFPEARVGHIGIQRDENTKLPIHYYSHFPQDISAGPVIIVDPMLATGGSAVHAADHLRKLGCDNIQMICLVAAPIGVEKMLSTHPNIPIFTAALDRELDQSAFIRPGLGDAGDRVFGTPA